MEEARNLGHNYIGTEHLVNVTHIRGIRNQVIRYPWSVAVDAKGRVSVPAPFRAVVKQADLNGVI